LGLLNFRLLNFSFEENFKMEKNDKVNDPANLSRSSWTLPTSEAMAKFGSSKSVAVRIGAFHFARDCHARELNIEP
jgi:hypothetical protein